MISQKKYRIRKKYLKNLEMDLYRIVWDLTAQVPPGRVTSYGAIAKALGDIRAARAVGAIEHVNPYAPKVPCHRVVYNDGGIGGFGAPEGVSKKIQLLSSEGIEVENGKIVDFQDKLFTKFKIREPRPLEQLREEQQELKKYINVDNGIQLDQIRTIGGLDASYNASDGFGAVTIMDFDTLTVLETQTVQVQIRFPYIPTYLSYHELPVTISSLNKLKITPDLIIFDGNGVLHPLGMGLATHAGIILRVPTMGIAKKLLCGDLQKTKNGQDDVFEVFLDNRIIGYGLKPKSAKNKLVYVSPGNNIGFKTALNIAEKICITRQPAPIKIAHELALEMKKKKKKEKKGVLVKTRL